MKIIGLTGSIGMGKTTVTEQFAAEGALTCNADDIVHQLLAEGGKGVEAVGAAFPSVREGNHINRSALGQIVFNDDAKLKELERILHPLVVQAEYQFVEEARRKQASIVVLDIPLLFETNAQTRVDVTVVVSAPYWIQRKRVLSRVGMTEVLFKRILEKQMPDDLKRAHADKVIYTGFGKCLSRWQVRQFIRSLHAS